MRGGGGGGRGVAHANTAAWSLRKQEEWDGADWLGPIRINALGLVPQTKPRFCEQRQGGVAPGGGQPVVSATTKNTVFAPGGGGAARCMQILTRLSEDPEVIVFPSGEGTGMGDRSRRTSAQAVRFQFSTKF